MKYLYQFGMITLMTIGLFACGGGSDSGGSGGGSGFSRTNFPNSAATVTPANQDDLVVAANEGAKQLVDGDTGSLPTLRSASVASSQSRLTDYALSLSTQLLQQTSAKFVVSENCDFGGSLEIDFVGVSEGATTFPSNGTIDYDFNNCSFDPGETINGRMRITYAGFNEVSGFTSYTIEFDITVNSDGVTETIRGSATCDTTSCDFSEDFTVDGVEYRVEGSTVTNNFDGTYDVSFRISHEDYGYIDVVADDINIDSAGNICSGTITISDSTGNALFIDFGSALDCTDADIVITEL